MRFPSTPVAVARADSVPPSARDAALSRTSRSASPVCCCAADVRGVLPCCTLDAYFDDMLGKIGLNYRPEDVYIGNYAGSLEALNAGITTLLDWSHISNTPEHSDEAVHGLQDAGIRGVYAHGIPGDNSWWAYSDRGHPDDIRRIR